MAIKYAFQSKSGVVAPPRRRSSIHYAFQDESAKGAQAAYQNYKAAKMHHRDDDAGFLNLGLSNLISMPKEIVTGLANTGAELVGGVVTGDPGRVGRTVQHFGQGLVSSALNVADTATLGIADAPLEDINNAIGAEGADIAPFYSRRGGILPALVTDVGTVAAAATPFKMAATSSLKAADAAYTAAKAAGDTEGMAAATLNAEAAAAQVAKLKRVTNPYESAAKEVLRPLTKKAATNVLEAHGVNPETMDSSGVIKANPLDTGKRTSTAPQGVARPELYDEIQGYQDAARVSDEARQAYQRTNPPTPEDAAKAAQIAAEKAAATGGTPTPAAAETAVQGATEAPQTVWQKAAEVIKGPKKEAQNPYNTRLIDRIGAKVENHWVKEEARQSVKFNRRMAEVQRHMILDSAPQGALAPLEAMLREHGVTDRTAVNGIVGSEVIPAIEGETAFIEAIGGDVAKARQEARQIPDSIKNDPEALAAWDKAVEGARGPWVKEAQLAFEEMKHNRPGVKGLEDVGSEEAAMSAAQTRALEKHLNDLDKALKLDKKVAIERGKSTRTIESIDKQIARNEAKLARTRELRASLVEKFDAAGPVEERPLFTQDAEGATTPVQYPTTEARPFGREAQVVPESVVGRPAVTEPVPPRVGELPGQRQLFRPEKRVPGEAPTLIEPGQAPATVRGAYRTGANRGALAARIKQTVETEARITKELDEAAKVRDQFSNLLENEAHPTEVLQAGAKAKAQAGIDKAFEGADQLSVARAPDNLKPLVQAALDVHEFIKNDATGHLAREAPETLSGLVEFMHENGIDPGYVSHMTEHQAQQLVHASLQPGANALVELLSSGRKDRVLGRGRYSGADVLPAGRIQAMFEARANAVTDYIEGKVAHGVAPGVKVPDSHVLWDPARGVYEGTVAPPQGGMIIPKTVAKMLNSYGKDYSHGVFGAISKVTNPWRTLILTLSPRWYVNNLFGNVMVAQAHGVSLTDWKKGFENYTKEAEAGSGGIYRSSGLASELDGGGSSLISHGKGVEGVKNAYKEGGVVGAGRQAKGAAFRWQDRVDQIARHAVEAKTVRTTEDAVKAVEAGTKMIDFHDLTPFESQAVRAVVPFYSWMKQIFKIAAKLPFDHPAVVPFMYAAGELNDQLQRERYGDVLPEAYSGIVPMGPLDLNTRGLNPFQDAAGLSTPEGIVRSINPFIGIGLRAGMNAPGFDEGRKALGPYGTAVQEVDPWKAALGVGEGLPMVQAGVGRYSTPVNVGRFLGLPVIPTEKTKEIVARTAKTRKSLEKSKK